LFSLCFLEQSIAASMIGPILCPVANREPIRRERYITQPEK
jgi:hypothetical protein